MWICCCPGHAFQSAAKVTIVYELAIQSEAHKLLGLTREDALWIYDRTC